MNKKLSSKKKLKSQKLDQLKEKETRTLASKKAAKKEKKSQKKNLRCCCGGCLIVFIVLILFVFYILSASGVAQIPLFSTVFFGDGPKPARQVEPSDKINEVFENKVTKAIIGGSDRLALSEQELTGFLANDKSLQEANLLVENDYAEFFAKLNDKKFPNIYITIRFNPTVKDSNLKLNIKSLRVGKVSFPAFIADYIISSGLKNYQLPNMKHIDNLSLEDNSLIIKGDIQKLFLSDNDKEIPQNIPETVDPKDLQSISPPER
jgi:uncharacterized protein YpmS